MAGLVPAIHDLSFLLYQKNVDARDKPGHDEFAAQRPRKSKNSTEVTTPPVPCAQL